MNAPTAYHQLGRFIVAFQHLEGAVNDLIELLADTADGEVVRILANDLEYGKRLNTTDVLFARFIDYHEVADESVKEKFHSLMTELRGLGERRNDLVHSRYNAWLDISGREGLLRRNSKLSGSKGVRQETEEELQPHAFDKDIERLANAATRLEEFRIKVIHWLYPD